MPNPWLSIPLADYEGHMALPAVGQAQLLARLLGASLDWHAPRSLAVLGCAGGNGFEHAARRALQRVVAVDIQRDYLDALRARFKGQIAGLELVCGDVQDDALTFEPVELVFAALLFEYVDPGQTLCAIRRLLVPGGTLVAVLQLPNASVDEITPSPFASLGALRSIMTLVNPQRLESLALGYGYHARSERAVFAAGAKQFQQLVFRR